MSFYKRFHCKQVSVLKQAVITESKQLRAGLETRYSETSINKELVTPIQRAQRDVALGRWRSESPSTGIHMGILANFLNRLFTPTPRQKMTRNYVNIVLDDFKARVDIYDIFGINGKFSIIMKNSRFLIPTFLFQIYTTTTTVLKEGFFLLILEILNLKLLWIFLSFLS